MGKNLNFLFVVITTICTIVVVIYYNQLRDTENAKENPQNEKKVYYTTDKV